MSLSLSNIREARVNSTPCNLLTYFQFLAYKNLTIGVFVDIVGCVCCIDGKLYKLGLNISSSHGLIHKINPKIRKEFSYYVKNSWLQLQIKKTHFNPI